jgi:hypothetical protein
MDPEPDMLIRPGGGIAVLTSGCGTDRESRERYAVALEAAGYREVRVSAVTALS